MADRPWPNRPKMPLLVDGHLTIAKLREAAAAAIHDGEQMTFEEGLEWLALNVHPDPHPPSPSTPPGTRGARVRRRYRTPAGRPGRLRTTEARAAA
ncbi:MAG TPA: hypothetical protein VEW95_05530 [Candidatus Limnocylindrales bacterium]|nr:hypothetical protein [Candidatus Limnocylindrales bacterium]